MANIGDLIQPRSAGHVERDLVGRGTVIGPAPATETDTLHLVLRSYDGSLYFEVPGGQWIAPAASPPDVGDTMLLVFDDLGDAWAFKGGLYA
jgi:hypothetical protein